MNTKLLQGPCAHCGKTIRYPAQLVGTTGKCPSCGQLTELLLEEPDIFETGIPKRTIFWTLATILVLVLGLVGAIIALNSARNLRQTPQPRRPAKEKVKVSAQRSNASIADLARAGFSESRVLL